MQNSEEGNETSGNNLNENKKAWRDASKMLWQLKEVEILILLPLVFLMTFDAQQILGTARLE